MDRFELEDLFLPHRRPEPEVQLALDRGLGELADRLVAAPPKEETPAPEAPDASPEPAATDEAAAAAPAGGEGQGAGDEAPAADPVAATDEVPGAQDAPAGEASASAAAETGPAEATVAEAPAAEGAPDEAPAAAEPSASADADAAPEPEPEPEPAPSAAAEPKAPEAAGVSAELPGVKERVELTPALAKLCVEFVRPDRGVHTEQEALAGAMRILSDRLGRDPALRRAVRKAMRKHGVLTVRPGGDESRLQRHRALTKLKEPIRQLQGRRLIQIRQAQKDRAITTQIQLDPAVIVPRVFQSLGRRFHPEYQGVVRAVAEQAFYRRLVPMIEADVRLELKERGDDEALRFLSQHLRQMLLSPVGGQRPVAGLTINAKQDWILVLVGENGDPTSAEIKIETREKDDVTLAEELGQTLRGSGVRAIAVGHGKGSMAQVPRLRECIRLMGAQGEVCIVTEAGLTSYANSELARKELSDFSVPARMAISLGRRFQDLLLELLKVDPRNLGLGMEAGLVSKANLRRTLQDTVESVIAFIGCDVNLAPLSVLKRLPGLDHETAAKLVELRSQSPIESREQLRATGVLSEAQWASCAAFLRVNGSPEPLDRTALHPEQYPLAQRLIESTGSTVSEALGKRGATKGLRRADFDIDETTWRDLIRELSFPGRDPRQRFFPPTLLPPDTDPASLEVGQILEGQISNLTSFGAFVDLGLPREGLIHISEAAARYVRDAREVLSIGQPVRARVLETGGQRITLSLKNVPPPERKRPARTGGGGRRGGERGPRKEGGDWPEPSRVVRAAQTRRDGLAGKKQRSEGGPKRRKQGAGAGAGGRGGGGRGFGGRGRGRGDREDYDAEAVRNAGKTQVSYNPFATFFEREGDGKDEGGADER